MSTPNGTGASRRARIAGLALLSLAVIAVLIGVVLATTGGPPSPAATPVAPAAPSSTPDPSGAPTIPSTIPYPPTATSNPAAAPIVPPIDPSAAAQGPSIGEERADPGSLDQGTENSIDQSHSRGEVRVYNNSTIRGLAARAADDLTAAGWTVVEVGNYAQGTIPTTTAYYQEGTDQRDYAEALGAEFGMRVEPRFPGIANADSGLIVIVTNDYASP